LIVVDASAAVLGLLNDGDARHRMADEELAVPHLADSEVANALRAQVARRRVAEHDAKVALDRWAKLGVRRHWALGSLPRIWELRHNLSAYDATYVALAEAMGCAMLTGDRRLAAAPGARCEMIVVRR
jgi:predicted nucleic acid-binding protein